MLKAYIVSAYGVEFEEIVWAQNANKAKSTPTNDDELNDAEYIYKRAKRAKWADKYNSMDTIPMELLLKNGWWWLCAECHNMPVFFEDIEHGAKIIDNKVYCRDCVKDNLKAGE